MAEVIGERLEKVLEMQEEGIPAENIAERLKFPSSQALRSFMNRQGYKSKKGSFVLKSNEGDERVGSNNKIEIKTKKEISETKKQIEIKEKNPDVDKVLDLQIYNMPLFKIASIVELTEIEIEKMMEEHGYIRVNDKFVVKPKPLPKTKKKAKEIKPKKKVKEKTKKQLQEEEFKRNPAKRGTFDPLNQVWVVNVQLVEIIELQLNKVPVSQIAKQMKMTKPGLIEFMEEKGYVLEDEKFIQRKFAKKIENQEDISDIDVTEKQPLKPRVYNDTKEDVEYTEESFGDLREDIQKLYNWYKRMQEHPIFKKD